MNTATGILLLAVALAAANVPFPGKRFFMLVLPPAGRDKGWRWRLFEALAFFFCTLGLARLLEARAGAVYPRGWEFYAIVACLFVVMGFPGFVYRYLWKGYA